MNTETKPKRKRKSDLEAENQIEAKTQALRADVNRLEAENQVLRDDVERLEESCQSRGVLLVTAQKHIQTLKLANRALVSEKNNWRDMYRKTQDELAERENATRDGIITQADAQKYLDYHAGKLGDYSPAFRLGASTGVT